MKSTSFLKFLSGSFSSRCLIFKVQFRCLSRGQLTEYITFSLPCQPLFSTFLKFFRRSQSSVSVIFPFHKPSLRFRVARLCTVFYHLFFLLSTSFSTFFLFFFHFLYTRPCVFGLYVALSTIYCIYSQFLFFCSICGCTKNKAALFRTALLFMGYVSLAYFTLTYFTDEYAP